MPVGAPGWREGERLPWAHPAPVARGQGDVLCAATAEECVAGHEEGIWPLARKSGKRRVDFRTRARVEHLDLEPDRAGSLLHVPQSGVGSWSIGWIDQHGYARGFGQKLVQET